MEMFDLSPSGGKPRLRFAAPEDILLDPALGGDERRRLLDDWKLELVLLATATAENMPDRNGQSGRAQPEELLRRVDACRRLLDEKKD